MQNMVKYNLCSCIHSAFHTAVCLQLPLMAVNASLYFEEKKLCRIPKTWKIQTWFFLHLKQVPHFLTTSNTNIFVWEAFTYSDEYSSHSMEKSPENGEGNLDTGREEIRWSTGAWKKLAVEASVGSEVWRRLRIKEKVEAWNRDVE